MRKSVFVVIAFLFLSIPGFSLVLPDGTVVDDANVTDNSSSGESVYYTFKDPVTIVAPYGKVKVVYAGYKGGQNKVLFYFILATGEKLTTPVGDFIADDVSYKIENGAAALDTCRIIGVTPVQTVFGILTLGEKDAVFFSKRGTVRKVVIAQNQKRQLKMEAGTVFVKNTIETEAESLADTRLLNLAFAKPADLSGRYGKLSCSEAKFNATGELVQGYLSKPQVIKTPAGSALCTSYGVHRNGSLEFVYLSGYQEVLKTSWGERKMSGKVMFSDGGSISAGSFAEPYSWDSPFGPLLVTGDFFVTVDYTQIYLSGTNTVKTTVGDLKLKDHFVYSHKNSILSVTTIEGFGILSSYGILPQAAGAVLSFYPEGMIRNMQLSGEAVIKTGLGEMSIVPGYYGLTFYPSGKIKYCTLKNPVAVKSPDGSFTCSEETSFFENGQIASTILLKPVSLLTPAGAVMVDSHVEFFENGLLKAGRISSPVTLEGSRFQKGQLIEFDDRGLLIKGPPEGH